MKANFVFMALTAFALTHCSSQPDRPLPTEAKVDLKRYTGHWYEVFRLPNSFQRDDSRATADYTALPDGSIQVVNTEYRPDGTSRKATGRAQVVPDGRNSRLKVKFTGLAALAPVSDEGNYWIIDVSPDYQTALVGTPDRNYLWLLSRTRTLAPQQRDQAVARAKELGFPVEKLIYPR